MHRKPDYATLRAETKFSSGASGTYLALLKLAEVPIRDFFLKPEACIEVYRVGRPKLREMFGPEIGMPGPSTPPVSYGHPNVLGAELMFPDDGEVAVQHLYSDSLAKGIAALRQPVDYANAGMFPFYREFQATMQKAFPEEKVRLSFGLEGPITTAYELRGDAFFYDPFDQPEKTREFLRLLTRSILDYHAFETGLRGEKPSNPAGAGLCDDVAAMIPPHLWDEFVLPYWDQYFNGMTTGKRSAHVEDLRIPQLKYLETIGLWHYDPSISKQINPRTIAANCRVPFGWRLGSFHYRNLTRREVEEFVFQAAADGASSVFTTLEGSMCTPETVEKVHTLMRAGKEVRRLLDAGCPRSELSQHVSAAGKKKFWDTWLK